MLYKAFYVAGGLVLLAGVALIFVGIQLGHSYDPAVAFQAIYAYCGVGAAAVSGLLLIAVGRFLDLMEFIADRLESAPRHPSDK